MDRFILLAARRSGTTLLLSSLDSHPQIQCYKRVFGLKRPLRYFFEFEQPGTPFFKYRSASTKRQIDYIFRRKHLIGAFLTEFYASVDGPKAVVARIVYSQAHKYPEALEWAIENDVGIIHLIRENFLKSIVSHFTSKRRGVFHSTSKVGPTPIHLSPDLLKRRLTVRTKQVEKYRAMLKNKRCCEVSYESFVANREVESRRILDFLSVDPSIPLTTDLRKQNPDSLADILENYEEVYQAFKGTAFEKYLVM
jgi:LPS sulfotransferase NodH